MQFLGSSLPAWIGLDWMCDLFMPRDLLALDENFFVSGSAVTRRSCLEWMISEANLSYVARMNALDLYQVGYLPQYLESGLVA